MLTGGSDSGRLPAMNQIQSTLAKFGLTPNETTVYVETLKQAETSPFALARATKIPRTTVYDVLMSLSLKGLVTLTQSDGLTKQQTRIKAKNPSELRQIIHQRQKELAKLDVEMVDILPQLKGDYHQQSEDDNFRFYPGIEGAKKVYFADYVDDMRVPIVAFENLMSMDAFSKEAINTEVSESTVKHTRSHRRLREIIPLTDWTRHALSYQYGRDPNYLVAREMRYLDNPVLEINQRTSIQGNRIAISCVKDDEAWGLVMNSPALAKSWLSVFEVLWQLARPVTPEFVKSLGPNLFLEAEKKK